MLFLAILIALLVLLIGWLLVRNWVLPWKQLDHLLTTISRGQRPTTFLLSGNLHARRIGPALEALLMRQQRLDEQVTKDATKMQAAFTALTDGLLVLDAGGHVVLSNPAFEKIWGRRATAGAPLLEVIHDVAAVQLIKVVSATSTAKTAEIESPDGKSQLQLTAVPIPGEDHSTGVIALFHDISELKRVDEIRRDFVANVSHELRTPLSIFRGNLEALLDGSDLDAKETERIYNVMKRHSDRLNLLVDDLLSLARLEARETKLQRDHVDLAEFLPRVLRDWTHRCAEKKLRLETRLPEELTLSADAHRLEEIIHNLLDNAVKYSNEGGRILASAEPRDHAVVLSVNDEGIGIPAEDLPRIFERFYRVDRARGRELGGTGLGLSIVKHIAQLHGGHVEAESAVGKGTTISVILPTSVTKT